MPQLHKCEIFFLNNSSSDTQGVALQSCTKYNMFCIWIFLKTEDSEGEISSSDKFGISVPYIQQSETSNRHI